LLSKRKRALPELLWNRGDRANRFVAELAAMRVLDLRSPRDIMDDLNAPSSSILILSTWGVPALCAGGLS